MTKCADLQNIGLLSNIPHCVFNTPHCLPLSSRQNAGQRDPFQLFHNEWRDGDSTRTLRNTVLFISCIYHDDGLFPHQGQEEILESEQGNISPEQSLHHFYLKALSAKLGNV